MSDFKCNKCGNTKYFHRSAFGSVAFTTKDEMENNPIEFGDWSDDITCGECYESDVEEM